MKLSKKRGKLQWGYVVAAYVDSDSNDTVLRGCFATRADASAASYSCSYGHKTEVSRVRCFMDDTGVFVALYCNRLERVVTPEMEERDLEERKAALSKLTPRERGALGLR